MTKKLENYYRDKREKRDATIMTNPMLLLVLMTKLRLNRLMMQLMLTVRAVAKAIMNIRSRLLKKEKDNQ